MIILQNDLFSFVLLNISFHHGQHTLLDNLPRVTAKSTLNATLQVAHMRFAAPSHLYPRLHLVCTYFIYWSNWLSLHNLAYFLSHYKYYWSNGRLARRKIWDELWRKQLWTLICFHVALYGQPLARRLSLLAAKTSGKHLKFKIFACTHQNKSYNLCEWANYITIKTIYDNHSL